MKSVKTIAGVILLLSASIGASTLIEPPAELKVRQTLFGKYKIFAVSKGHDLPNVVNRVSIMMYGVDGQHFKRENVLCPCGIECVVDNIPLLTKKTLIGVWDKRLDDCEKAPRGHYSVTMIGPVEQEEQVLPVVYGHTSMTVR